MVLVVQSSLYHRLAGRTLAETCATISCVIEMRGKAHMTRRPAKSSYSSQWFDCPLSRTATFVSRRLTFYESRVRRVLGRFSSFANVTPVHVTIRGPKR